MTSDTLTANQKECAVIAIEEMAELTKVLSKILRFGLDENKELEMAQEIGDVLCLIQLLHDNYNIGYDVTSKATERKQVKLMKWSNLYDYKMDQLKLKWSKL